MEIPQNCHACKYTNDCWSYYGGSMCKYKDEIYRANHPAAKEE